MIRKKRKKRKPVKRNPELRALEQAAHECGLSRGALRRLRKNCHEAAGSGPRAAQDALRVYRVMLAPMTEQVA